MSFFKSLFGKGQGKAPKPGKQAEHKGYIVEATPYKEGGQYQLSGVISKEINGVRKEYRFVRADRFASEDEAADFALVKGRQIIDEQGERIFS